MEEEEIFQDASEHSDSIEEFTSSASDAPSQASQSILREVPPVRAHEPPLAEEAPSVLVASQSAPALESPLVETTGVVEGSTKEIVHQSPPVEETSSEIVPESPLIEENSALVEEGSSSAAPGEVPVASFTSNVRSREYKPFRRFISCKMLKLDFVVVFPCFALDLSVSQRYFKSLVRERRETLLVMSASFSRYVLEGREGRYYRNSTIGF